MSGYYPIFLNIVGFPCLVVGGGDVAERKVEALRASGAVVKLISPALTPLLQSLALNGEINWFPRAFQRGDTVGSQLVISATNHEEVNRQVYEECNSAGILVNVVDDPAKCSFLVPAVVRRGDLCIAVSTGGASPLAARKIREELEDRYGPEYDIYLKLLAAARREALTRHREPEKRRRVFERLNDGNLLSLLKDGRVDAAKELVKKCLS